MLHPLPHPSPPPEAPPMASARDMKPRGSFLLRRTGLKSQALLGGGRGVTGGGKQGAKQIVSSALRFCDPFYRVRRKRRAEGWLRRQLSGPGLASHALST